MSVTNQVREYIKKHNMLEKGDTIVLGISGGGDSICLLFVLLELKEEYDLELVGVHINHNLRGIEAIEDQRYVEYICKEQQVECIVVSEDIQKEAKLRGRSLEEAGREVRQEVFKRVAEQIREEALNKGVRRSVKIATAHHGNDNAETLLMNLVRGSGIVGLGGIAPVRGERIRPLLGIQRSEIESYLQEAKLEYCTDSTNAHNIYTRNVIRNEIIPKFEECVNSQSVAHMNQAIEELKKIEMYLEKQVEEAWASCVSIQVDYESTILYKEEIEKQELILKERIVKKSIEQVAGYQRDIMRVHIEQVLKLFEKQVGKEIHLPYQLVARRIYEGVEICRVKEETNLFTEGMKITIPGKTYLGDGSVVETEIITGVDIEEMLETPYTKYFECDIMTNVLCLRTRNVGDYIVINSQGNKQKLKKFYIANKIPLNQRDQIPLVTIGEEVLWVVGHRRSYSYKVKENTKKVLKIQYDGGNHGRDN